MRFLQIVQIRIAPHYFLGSEYSLGTISGLYTSTAIDGNSRQIDGTPTPSRNVGIAQCLA